MRKTFVLKFVQDAGLGNQIFEWATGYGISKRLGIPYNWVWSPSKKRKFGLGIFGIEENPPAGDTELVMDRVGQGNATLVEIAEKRVTASESPHPAVTCPFQAEECFIDVADEIREKFKLDPLPLNVPEGRTPVAVQVRQGDYKNHPRLDVVAPAYFAQAMHRMKELVPNPHFFFTSDDLPWCQEHFGRRSDVTILPPHSMEDGLRMMVACEAHIISNSTYGWWGAWLGEKGPVIAPDKWHMVPGSYGAWEPVPKRWHRVGGTKKDTMRPLIDVMPFKPLETLPSLDRAIVIPWKKDAAKWRELRFCLRAIDKFFEDRDCPIYILGTNRPGFLLFENHRVKCLDTWSYWEALNTGTQLAKKVLWMNDDVFFLKPTTWEECATPLYLAPIQQEFLDKVLPQANAWRQGVVKVLQQLHQMGYEDHKIYSTHTPYVYERDKSVEVLEEFGVWDKMPFEMAYFHMFPEGSRKVTTEKTVDHNFGDANYLNLVDAALTKEVKQALADLLPDYPAWELNRPFQL